MAARIHVSSDPEENSRHAHSRRATIPAVSTLYHQPITNRIELHNCAISIQDVAMLARGIQGNKTMRALHLSFNGIGPAGAELIAEALMHNRTIQELFLTDNAVGDAGAAALAVTMASHPELSDVKLCGNSIGNQGVQHIANTAIRADNHALKRIDLSYNKFDDNGARSLADAMRVNKHVLSLRIVLASKAAENTHNSTVFSRCSTDLIAKYCTRNHGSPPGILQCAPWKAYSRDIGAPDGWRAPHTKLGATH